MLRRMFLFIAVMGFILTANLYSQLSLELVWKKQQGGVIDAKFSPDGKFIYCAVGADINKLDVVTGEFVATFDKGELTNKNIYLDISLDGKTIITGNNTGKWGVYLWDTESLKVLREIKVEGITENQELYLASFTPDNRHVLLTLYTEHTFPEKPTNEILLFDLLENKVIKKVSYKRIEQMQYSKDGKYFITGTRYEDICRVTLWDAKELTVIREYTNLETNNIGFRKIQISDNNKLIGVMTETFFVKIIETETGNIVKTSDPGMLGYNFEFFSDDYYLIYQWIENHSYYNSNIYKYPDDFQSNLNIRLAGVLISKTIVNEGQNNLLVFNGTSSISLLKNSTSSVNEPVKNEFSIKVEPYNIYINFDLAESIKIIDINGKILFEQEVNGTSTSIPNTFSPGTYICVIKAGSKDYSQKFQVVR